MKDKINCQGCCWMKRAGIEVYRCDQTQCPFWGYFFAQHGQILDTCFT